MGTRPPTDSSVRESGMTERVEVAVVGGGLAGAAVATALARAGREAVVIERQPVWRWRACGVFCWPASGVELAGRGLDAGASRIVVLSHVPPDGTKRHGA